MSLIIDEWEKYAKDHLVGKKIIAARYMSEEEKDTLGFFNRALILTLDDGTIIYPSADDEGNDAGALFGQDKNNKELVFPVI